MDQKQIGAFLKELRKQKGLTQEQLAEKFYVSNRSVSRWENGNNLPDLCTLVMLAEYYAVDIREILAGERRSGEMEREIKDTLEKVADYGDMQKRKAAQAGSRAFGLTFIVCAAVILAQLLVWGNLLSVLGETLVLLTGGVVYLKLIVDAGAFDGAYRRTGLTPLVVSVGCAGVFSVALFLFMYLRKPEPAKLLPLTLLFFLATAAAGWVVLSFLGRANKKARNRSESLPKIQ